MREFLLVCLGGAVGSGARYAVSLAVFRFYAGAFPWATFIVNTLGSFLMALLMDFALREPNFSPTLRLTLAAGVLGGFTTYSAFNHETLTLLRSLTPMAGLVNVAATVFGALVAGFLGLAASRALE
jgi:CrcB protein